MPMQQVDLDCVLTVGQDRGLSHFGVVLRYNKDTQIVAPRGGFIKLEVMEYAAIKVRNVVN
jgi:hypothetical protein